MKEHCIGPLLNSSRREGNVRYRKKRIQDEGLRLDSNCYIDWKNWFYDEDEILRIPIRAKRAIKKGEKLIYSYPFHSGHHDGFVVDSSDSEGESP